MKSIYTQSKIEAIHQRNVEEIKSKKGMNCPGATIEPWQIHVRNGSSMLVTKYVDEKGNPRHLRVML